MSDVGFLARLARVLRPVVDLPTKLDPTEFGGGRSRGVYTQGEIERLMCSRAGCGRRAHAAWSGCADGNVQRPLCAEHDIEVNRLVEEWWGSPEWETKIVDYANGVQGDVDRDLDIPWLTR